MNIKNLSKNKKIAIVVSVVAVVIALIGVVIGSKVGEENVQINTEKLESLIETPYEVTKKGETSDNADFVLVGELSEEDLESLVKQLYDVGSFWNKKSADFYVFASEDDVTDTNAFYVKGLKNRISIDFENKKAKIGAFSEVPATEKAKKLANYNQGFIATQDGTTTITMDMSLSGLKTTEVVAQSKAFIQLFKDNNKDKDLKTMELHLNGEGEKDLYNYNTGFENILESVKVVKF